MSKLLSALSLAAIGLVSFVGTALAATNFSDVDPSGFARTVFDYVMAGHYIAAAAAALVLVVALAKRYAPGRLGEWLHSDAGGSIATFFMSLGGALMTATAGGATWHWGMLATSAKVAFFAAGGYVLIKKALVEPLLKPLSAKAPGWMQPLFSMVWWVFDKKVASTATVSSAITAGDAAVAAHPASGANGINGKPVDL